MPGRDGGDPYGTDDPAVGGIVLWAVRRVLLWGGLGLALYLAVGYRGMLMPAGGGAASQTASAVVTGAVGAAAAPSAPAAVPNSLVFHADPRGHVELGAEVNGAPVRFLVDTGATYLTLTPQDAEAAGIDRDDLVFDAAANTANGRVRMALVTLREVRIQQLDLYDVPAAVVENLGTSLLGMSFLTRLDSYEMSDGVLTMNW
jgi:aspartyl protease family protein